MPHIQRTRCYIVINKTWRTINLPDALIEEISKFLKTKEAKRQGFTSISGFVAHCIRKQLTD